MERNYWLVFEHRLHGKLGFYKFEIIYYACINAEKGFNAGGLSPIEAVALMPTQETKDYKRIAGPILILNQMLTSKNLKS